MPKISMVSLGCAKNMVDAEMALATALESGFDLALDPAEADIVLINTCGFIQPARDESREVIQEFLDLKNSSGGRIKVVVMGCLSERSPLEMAEAFPAVDALWGLDIIPELPAALERLLHSDNMDKAGFGKPEHPHEGARLLSTLPAYAYLKISDGCDNRCAYCAIPDIRGPFRSRPFDAIIEEATLLEDQGAQELVVISQDTTLYGRDFNKPGIDITALIEKLLTTVRVPRIRLLYAHPAHLGERLTALLLAEPRLCRYLDIPFQHVSNRILRLMGRGYGSDRVEEILERFGGGKFTIRTTLMTGFPGETEEDFLQALALASSGRIQHLGAFAYSPEEGTPAASFTDLVQPEEAARRLDAILTAQRRSAFAWLDSRIGGVETVLIDRPAGKGWMEGRTTREAPDADGVVFVQGSGIQPGDLVEACINGREEYDLLAYVGKKERRIGKSGRRRR